MTSAPSTETTGKRAAVLLPVVAGLIFAAGLVVSGMAQPAKVIGFLDFSGRWDPTLAFVMLGAVGVTFAATRAAARRSRPLFCDRFVPPGRSAVDLRLVCGSAIFGIGWGLSGFCPGPALVSFGGGAQAALWFVPALVVGMLLFHRLDRRKAPGGDG